MNILTYSPSSRKIWTQPQTRVLNHVYWLLPYLMGKLADDINVFTIDKSFSPVGKMKHYKGEKIDMIVSLGASYSPATLNAQFTKGFSRHERIFEVGEIVKNVKAKFNPLDVNLAVDVRTWFPQLTEIFGGEPEIFITEQVMKWQQVGYYYNNKVYKSKKWKKQKFFFFAGGQKKRGESFLNYTKNLKLPKIIHGGGWEDLLKESDNFTLHGFQHFRESLKYKCQAMYGLVLHEPIGNEAGWITSKFFEYLGTDTVCFVANEYDKGNLYIPKDYILRVNNAEEINELISKYGYEYLLKEQRKLINKEWANFDKWFYLPFKQEIEKIWDAQKK